MCVIKFQSVKLTRFRVKCIVSNNLLMCSTFQIVLAGHMNILLDIISHLQCNLVSLIETCTEIHTTVIKFSKTTISTQVKHVPSPINPTEQKVFLYT